MAALATATTAAAAATGDDNDDDAAGGSGAALQGLQAYRLGALAPAEYRAELRAVNTQGDAGARALSARVRVPGGWCGWEAAEGGLTCNESVALIGASSLVALCLAGLACRRYVLRRRGQGQPLLWHGRAVVDDAEDDAHELSSIGEETSIGVPIGVGGKVRSKATLWQGAGGGGAARGGGPGAEAMRLRLDELRWGPPSTYDALYLLCRHYLRSLLLLWLDLRQRPTHCGSTSSPRRHTMATCTVATLTMAVLTRRVLETEP